MAIRTRRRRARRKKAAVVAAKARKWQNDENRRLVRAAATGVYKTALDLHERQQQRRPIRPEKVSTLRKNLRTVETVHREARARKQPLRNSVRIALKRVANSQYRPLLELSKHGWKGGCNKRPNSKKAGMARKRGGLGAFTGKFNLWCR